MPLERRQCVLCLEMGVADPAIIFFAGWATVDMENSTQLPTKDRTSGLYWTAPFTSTFFDITAFRQRLLNIWTLTTLRRFQNGRDSNRNMGAFISVLGAWCLVHDGAYGRLCGMPLAYSPAVLFYLVSICGIMWLLIWWRDGDEAGYRGWGEKPNFV
jgi:hypothetical protein